MKIAEELNKKLDELPISPEERAVWRRSLENPTQLYPAQIVFNEKEHTLRMPDETTIKFKEMVDSIRAPRLNAIGEVIVDHGLILPIAVRPLAAEGRPGMYTLVDGGHRLRAWQTAFGNSKPIPVVVWDLDVEQVMIAQVQANVISQKQQRAEIGQQMKRLLNFHDTWTVDNLSQVFHIQKASVIDYLSLTRLPDAIQKRVNLESTDPKSLPATVGYALAKFSPDTKRDTPDKIIAKKEAQTQWLERYESLRNEPQGFERWCGEVHQALSTMKKEGRKPRGENFTPQPLVLVPTMRKKNVLETQLTRARETVASFEDSVRSGARDLVKEYKGEIEYLRAVAWNECLEYVLQLDEDTKRNREEIEAKRAQEKKATSEDRKAGNKADAVSRITKFSNLF